MSFPMSVSLNSQALASTAIQNRPLVLNEGQMFHGQVKQLYPGQMAEIQIGGQKLFAKLEVSMKAGDSYFFKVSAVKPEMQLKIIAGPLQAAEGQSRQLGALMDAMQLPKTPEMQSLLAFAMKNKIPMSREGLLEAEHLLKSVPATLRKEALASIQKLAELKLPFTESIFRSLLGVQTKEGMHTVLTTLKTALIADSAVTPQLKESILTALDKMAKPFAQATGGAVLGQSLLTILDQNEHPETRYTILQLLKGVGVFPEGTSLANLQQILPSMLTSESAGRTVNGTSFSPITQQAEMSHPTLQPSQSQPSSPQNLQQIIGNLRQIVQTPQVQLDASLSNLKALLSANPEMDSQQKMMLMAIVERATNAQPSTQSVAKFVQEFSQALLKVTAENAIATPLQTIGSPQGSTNTLLTLLGQQVQQGAEKLTSLIQMAERSDNSMIQKMVQIAETTVATAVDGKAMKEAMQTVVRSLGMNYEAGLLSGELEIRRLAETVKPQLLTLLQDSTVSANLREAAETVVMRMNGTLLQSGENGTQHQLVMQIPLEFFGKRIDSTLQWNGRLKENGKIDPDFARILFYLDLESIAKTVIDMQVQNRVVTVTVYNEDDTIKAMEGGLPLQTKLKEGLELAGYLLSGVFFKTFTEEEKTMPKRSTPLKSDGQGVDFRI